MLAATGGIRDTKLGETEAVSCFPDACSGKSRMANKKGTLRLEASRMECNHRKSVETDKPKKNMSVTICSPHEVCFSTWTSSHNIRVLSVIFFYVLFLFCGSTNAKKLRLRNSCSKALRRRPELQDFRCQAMERS